ncbi:hypothetical protein Tco_1035298 [Tanacetum coccineum]
MNPLLGTSLPHLPKAGKKLRSLGKRKLPSGVGDSRSRRLWFEKNGPQASKVAGEASDPLDVDSIADIHEFPSAKELKNSADCHWVVDHGYSPFWKKTSSLNKLKRDCDIMIERICANLLLTTDE